MMEEIKGGKDPYAACRDLIGRFETRLKGQALIDHALQKGWTPVRARDFFATCLQEVANVAALNGDEEKNPGDLEKGLRHAQSPEFLTYLKGRMGAV
jgi:hypothetical protein